MSRRQRMMPKALQIHLLKKRFLKANADREDPAAEMDNIDWEAHVDEALSFPENVGNMKDGYPEYSWELPPKEPCWRIEDCPEHDSTLFKTDVDVERHQVKVAGKTYVYGRIQVSAARDLIGLTAEIIVEVPNFLL